MSELDKLLDRVQAGGARYGSEAYVDGLAARNAIKRQVFELGRLLTPAEGSPLQVAREILRRGVPDGGPDALAAELVGALGLFARPGGTDS